MPHCWLIITGLRESYVYVTLLTDLYRPLRVLVGLLQGYVSPVVTPHCWLITTGLCESYGYAILLADTTGL